MQFTLICVARFEFLFARIGGVSRCVPIKGYLERVRRARTHASNNKYDSWSWQDAAEDACYKGIVVQESRVIALALR